LHLSRRRRCVQNTVSIHTSVQTNQARPARASLDGRDPGGGLPGEQTHCHRRDPRGRGLNSSSPRSSRSIVDIWSFDDGLWPDHTHCGIPTPSSPSHPPVHTRPRLTHQGGHIGWIDAVAMSGGSEQWYLRLFFEFIEAVGKDRKQQPPQQQQQSDHDGLPLGVAHIVFTPPSTPQPAKATVAGHRHCESNVVPRCLLGA